jgi:acetyl-CoA carboxylase carboxyl transferase subunit alpha
MKMVADALDEELEGLEGLNPQELRKRRSERFYAIGRSGLQ